MDGSIINYERLKQKKLHGCCLLQTECFIKQHKLGEGGGAESKARAEGTFRLTYSELDFFFMVVAIIYQQTFYSLYMRK